MILGAEIGMLVIGILTLVSGKLVLARTRVVTGAFARQLAWVLLAPIPLAYTAHGFVHQWFVERHLPVGNSNRFYWTLVAVEATIVVLCGATVYLLGWWHAIDPARQHDEDASELRPVEVARTDYLILRDKRG